MPVSCGIESMPQTSNTATDSGIIAGNTQATTIAHTNARDLPRTFRTHRLTSSNQKTSNSPRVATSSTSATTQCKRGGQIGLKESEAVTVPQFYALLPISYVLLPSS